MKIGFIGGTGNLGFGLALRSAKEEYEVLIGSRSKEKALDAASRIREALPNASVSGDINENIAKISDLLFLSLPFAAQDVTLPGIAPFVKNKIVVDTTVPMKYGKPPVYQAPEAGSAAENVKKLLPDAIILSGFHTVSAASLADKDRTLDCDALLCGDDDKAKNIITGICAKFITRILDAGPLANAQSIERLTPLVITLNQIYKRRHIGIKLTGLE